MINKQLLGATLTGILSAAIAPIVNAEPAKIWTTWESSGSLTQSQCMSKAERAIRSLGYNHQVLQSGVYGEDGDYSVTIRCLTQKNLVFFIATHPNTEWASEELIALVEKF